MSDLFSIAKSGMSASQRSMATVSHNIANVATEGYSRQKTVLSTRTPSGSGGLYFGNGVNIAAVNRSSNDLINQQLRAAQSDFGELDAFHDAISRLDTFLSSDKTSLSSGLNDFFSALHGAIQTPGNASGREVLFSESEKLSKRFQTIYQQLVNEAEVVDDSIGNAVAEVNQLASDIARVNQQLSLDQSSPPDILDERDRLLGQLSELIGISTISQDDGAVNVFIGSGQSVVVGGTSSSLTTVISQEDPTRIDVAFVSSSGTQPINRDVLNGGQLGGLINLRANVVEGSIKTVDRLAVGLAYYINNQHREGLDLSGNYGTDFFSDVNTASAQRNRSINFSSNNGTAELAVSIQDANLLTDNSYQLQYNNTTSYTLTNLTTGISQEYSSLPQTVDGFQIQLGAGSFVSGDNFRIEPGRYAARDLRLNIQNPSAIALASPIRTQASAQNQGNAEILPGDVSDITHSSFANNGQITPPIKVEFLSDREYRLLDANTDALLYAGPFAYNSAISNEIFPTQAVAVGASSGLVNAASLAALNAGDLTLNGAAIAPAAADGVSTSDATASAIATAAAINASNATHGVSATVESNVLNLGTYTPDTLAAGDFQINGQNIIPAAATLTDLVSAINLLSNTTGVSASANASNEVVLTALDGRNIQLTNTGATATATFTNFDMLTGPRDEVQRAEVRLYSDANFTVGGAAPTDVAFTAGTYSTFDPGYRAKLSGTPVAGDSFVVQFNQNGIADGRNGLEMANIYNQKLFGNNTANMNAIYSSLLVGIGNQSAQADARRETAETLVEQIQDRRDAISGVNLDEEAANLLEMEQIFSANAQVIRVASQTIQVLFDSIG